MIRRKYWGREQRVRSKATYTWSINTKLAVATQGGSKTKKKEEKKTLRHACHDRFLAALSYGHRNALRRASAPASFLRTRRPETKWSRIISLFLSFGGVHMSQAVLV